MSHPHARMFPAASPLPPPLVPDLKTICSWCEKEGRETILRDGVEPISHGICRDHAVRLLADVPKAPERSEA